MIVNEFGAIGLDHLLIEAVDDDLVLLSAGCLCCSVRGDLVRALEDLLRRRDNGRIPPFRRCLIETTGIADPAPVLGAVLNHPYLSRRYALAGVVTLVDAAAGAATLDAQPEALRQVAIADRILLSKTDLQPDHAALSARLRELNRAAPILRAADAPADAILPPAPVAPGDRAANVAAWLGAASEADEAHVERFDTFVLTAERPFAPGALDLALDLLRSTFGPRLLRFKGLAALADDPDRPLVVQGVQHLLHVAGRLPAWPDEDRRTRLVLITDGVPRTAVERLWNAFAGLPAPDQPDARAVSDNPLAPATMRRRV